ncbi:hypothetical protein D3C75_653560 [compost metagenome]
MAVSRIGVAGGPCRRGQRCAVAGGVVAIGFNRRTRGAILGLGQAAECVVGVFGQHLGTCTALQLGDRTDGIVAIAQ